MQVGSKRISFEFLKWARFVLKCSRCSRAATKPTMLPNKLRLGHSHLAKLGRTEHRQGTCWPRGKGWVLLSHSRTLITAALVCLAWRNFTLNLTSWGLGWQHPAPRVPHTTCRDLTSRRTPDGSSEGCVCFVGLFSFFLLPGISLRNQPNSYFHGALSYFPI